MSNLKIDPLKTNCNLCGKGQDEVTLLIAGAYGNICGDCIAACVTILAENFGKGDKEQSHE